MTRRKKEPEMEDIEDIPDEDLIIPEADEEDAAVENDDDEEPQARPRRQKQPQKVEPQLSLEEEEAVIRGKLEALQMEINKRKFLTEAPKRLDKMEEQIRKIWEVVTMLNKNDNVLNNNFKALVNSK